MADVTKSVMDLNAGTLITSNAGAASQTIVWNRGDEKVLIRVSNADATTALIRFDGDGFGAPVDVDMQVAQNEVKGIFLESMRVKDPSTQKVTVQILDTDGTAFSGTVTNVAIEVIESFKSLTD